MCGYLKVDFAILSCMFLNSNTSPFGDLRALPARGMDDTAGVLDRTPGDGPMTSH